MRRGRVFYCLLVMLAASAAFAASPTTRLVTISPEAMRLNASLKEATARGVFDEIARQAGETFEPWPATLFEDPPLNDARFNVVFEKEPFWQAFLEATEQTHLAWSLRSTGPSQVARISLSNSVEDRGRPCYRNGAFLMTLDQLARSNEIHYNMVKRRPDHIVIGMTLLPEAKFRTFCNLQEVRTKRAVDDAGNNLKPIQSPRPQVLMPWTVRESFQHFGVTLEDPEHPGKRLRELAGEVELSVLKDVLIVETALTPGEVTIPAGRNRLLLHVDNGRGLPTLTLTVLREEESNDAWAESVAIWQASGIEVSLSDHGVVSTVTSPGVQCLFLPEMAQLKMALIPQAPARGGRPMRPDTLIVRLALSRQTITTKFQFKDIPLP